MKSTTEQHEPLFPQRAVEALHVVLDELVAAAERLRREEQMLLSVKQLAERTGQTTQGIYAQVKRRAVNGLDDSGALHKPAGQRRGWRIQLDAYLSWLSGGPD